MTFPCTQTIAHRYMCVHWPLEPLADSDSKPWAYLASSSYQVQVQWCDLTSWSMVCNCHGNNQSLHPTLLQPPFYPSAHSRYKDTISQVYLGPRIGRFSGLTFLLHNCTNQGSKVSLACWHSSIHLQNKLFICTTWERWHLWKTPSFCVSEYMKKTARTLVGTPLGWINHGRETPLHSTEPQLIFLCPLVAFHRLIHRSAEHG